MAQYVKNDINYHGARSKTTGNNSRRQRQDSGTKKNQNFVNSNNSNASNPPRTSYSPPAYNYGIWDDLPANPTPIENAWEQDREVSGWSKRNRKFRTDSDNSSIRVQQEKPEWNDINSEFPPLENKPVVNVWEVRQKKFQAKKAMEPTDENEEERMIRQAMELSKIEATKDEQKRRELEEEYKMQMHLMELNPLDFEEFRTDEEIASTLSTMTKDVPIVEDFNHSNYFPEDVRSKKKESRKYNALNHEESYTRASNQDGLRNGKQNQERLQMEAEWKPLPKNYSKKSLSMSERTVSGSENKKKISKVVEMFGGWGQLDKNSQKPVESKEAAVASPTPTLSAENYSEKNQTTVPKKNKTTKTEVPRNVTEEKNSKQEKKDEILKAVSEHQQKSNVNYSISKDENNFNSHEDFGWGSDRNESEFGAKSKDKDWAWTSEDTAASVQPQNPIAMKTEEKHHSVTQKHSSKPKSSSNESGELAKSIVSDYVKIAAKCESTSPKDDQIEKNLVRENKPSSDVENVFDMSQNDFVEGTSPQNSQADPFNSVKHNHSLPNDPQAVPNSSKLQLTNPETTYTKNEISYSLKNIPHNASESSISNENGWNKLHGSGNSASQSPSLHSQHPDQMDDNDISLPLFSAVHNNANNLSGGNSATPIDPPKPPVIDMFPESLGAHFQQFQMPHQNPMPPVFANPNFLNPSLMVGMSPVMMQQMLINPFFMQEMQAFYMSRSLPMGGVGFPYLPQSMPGIPNFQPFVNLASSNPPRSAESLVIDPPIPAPNQRSDFTENNGMDHAQIGSNLVLPEANSESDGWLEQYLLKEPQLSQGRVIPPPSMPEESALDGNALNFLPAPRSFSADAYDTAQARSVPTNGDDSQWIDNNAAWSNASASNDDWECKSDSSKSMRNSSRYVAERNKENRQPASQPCFSRGFR